MNSDDGKLTQVLSAWRIAPGRSGGFRVGVWAKIERARREAAWAGFVRARAVPCAALLVVALGVGAWTGREQARGRVEAERAGILNSYVQALDARVMVMR